MNDKMLKILFPLLLVTCIMFLAQCYHEDTDTAPGSGYFNADLDRDCMIGSRIGKIEGTYATGASRPEVMWVFFCRRG